jgi:hypothetical protein
MPVWPASGLTPATRICRDSAILSLEEAVRQCGKGPRNGHLAHLSHRRSGRGGAGEPLLFGARGYCGERRTKTGRPGLARLSWCEGDEQSMVTWLVTVRAADGRSERVRALLHDELCHCCVRRQTAVSPSSPPASTARASTRSSGTGQSVPPSVMGMPCWYGIGGGGSILRAPTASASNGAGGADAEVRTGAGQGAWQSRVDQAYETLRLGGRIATNSAGVQSASRVC